eukprot:gene10230-11324_t
MSKKFNIPSSGGQGSGTSQSGKMMTSSPTIKSHHHQSSTNLINSITRINPIDHVIEGLRIPSSLDSQQAVNFVLTQEPGKLKPKDLKIAIEKNRAEREKRTQEQKKLRELGGGAGVLDLRSILGEDRLNATPGDAFRKQLREIAFLADVEEVEKLEAEKEFRISENYLGVILLSENDIHLIEEQRKLAEQYAFKEEWKKNLTQNRSLQYPSSHFQKKPGVLGTANEEVIRIAHPIFDPNRNDIWAKRMNTLRRFIYLVSRWIIRRRVRKRFDKILTRFREAGAQTREEVRAFIERENEEYKNNSITSSLNEESSKKEENQVKSSRLLTGDNITFAQMVFSEPNESLVKRNRDEEIIQRFKAKVKNGEPELTTSMARRLLFPSFDRDLLSDQALEKQVSINDLVKEMVTFDDRTFFHLKVKPDFKIRKYSEYKIPAIQMYFPTGADKELRLLAPEEQFLRPPVDAYVTEKHLDKLFSSSSCLPGEPQELNKIREETMKTLPDGTLNLFSRLHDFKNIADSGSSKFINYESVEAPPAWLSQVEIEYTENDLDVHTLRPNFRCYMPSLPYSEDRPFYPFRPCLEAHELVYHPDDSLRTKWSENQLGFGAANEYLLGGIDSLQRLEPSQLPECGPTLIDYYLPNHDRHVSGLNVFEHDDQRDLLTWDRDIRPLQATLDKEDLLTDSESDEDEAYVVEKPTMKMVKALLAAPVVREEEKVDPKAKKDPKKDAKAKDKAPPAKPETKEPPKPTLPEPSVADDGSEALLGEHERREEQVELLRDRKLLDLSSTVLRSRKKNLEAVYKTFQEAAKRSHPFYSFPVSVPFHLFEDKVYAQMASHVPERSQLLMELDPRMMPAAPPTTLSMTSLPPFSPTKE